jgi:hypothetical protein
VVGVAAVVGGEYPEALVPFSVDYPVSPSIQCVFQCPLVFMAYSVQLEQQ